MKGYKLDPDRKLTKAEIEMLDRMESMPITFLEATVSWYPFI